MKICVTGANGFVGSNLCKGLIANDHEVRGLVRASSDLQFIDKLKGLEIYTGDITDKNSLRQAFKGIDLVYHAAAYTSDWGDWQTFRRCNIDGVNNVIESAIACGVKRLVHVSSVSVYGFPAKIDTKEEDGWLVRPGDPYVSSKQQGEKAALGFNGKGIEVVVLRPGGLYGPNDRTTSIKLFPEIVARRFPFIDDGRHIMAPCYIDNLVQAALLAGFRENARGQAYNIVDAGRTTWRQYVLWVCENLACQAPLLSIPAWFVWPLACIVESAAKLLRMKHAPFITRYRIRAVMGDSHFSIAKAQRELGYKPQISTQEGLKRTVDWYLKSTGKNRNQQSSS